MNATLKVGFETALVCTALDHLYRAMEQRSLATIQAEIDRANRLIEHSKQILEKVEVKP